MFRGLDIAGLPPHADRLTRAAPGNPACRGRVELHRSALRLRGCGGEVLELALSCVWLAIVAWLIGRAFGQRGLLHVVAPTAAPEPEAAKTIAIVVPARDEQQNIKRCLLSLLAQTYPSSRLHLYMVDDHSSDATVAIAAALARDHRQLTVLHSPPLPPRWVGKSHACWIGAQAVASDTEWLCFVDADVWGEPALLAGAVAAADRAGLALLSLTPRQQLRSFAERLVMPCGLYLLGFSQDLRALQTSDGDEATATGQFLLIRRSAYVAVGGHAAVRDAVCEDLMLTRLVKRSGRPVMLMDGSRVLATRMYTGWSTLWIGVSKNLIDMLGGAGRTLSIALAAIVLAWAAYLIPALDMWGCARGSADACWALAPGLAGSAAAFGLHIAGASYFGIPLWYGLLFPLGYTSGAFMALDSIRRRLGGSVSWKGRTYP